MTDLCSRNPYSPVSKDNTRFEEKKQERKTLGEYSGLRQTEERSHRHVFQLEIAWFHNVGGDKRQIFRFRRSRKETKKKQQKILLSFQKQKKNDRIEGNRATVVFYDRRQRRPHKVQQLQFPFQMQMFLPWPLFPQLPCRDLPSSKLQDFTTTIDPGWGVDLFVGSVTFVLISNWWTLFTFMRRRATYLSWLSRSNSRKRSSMDTFE